MKDFEQQLLKKMVDIEGLREVSIYPFAVGYQVFIVLAVIVTFTLLYFSYKKYMFRKSWHYSFYLELINLEKQIKKSTLKETLGNLNELLKRYCIKKYSRKEVAALNGNKWLRWLALRDPNGFDWVKKGVILQDYLYMPEEKISLRKAEIRSLISALKGWV